MSSSDKFEVVWMVELLTNVLTERIASASGRDSPATTIIRVRPEKIADWAFVRYFHDSIELLYLVEGVDAWWKSSVEAEDVSFDHGREWQIIKEWSKMLPHISIAILPKAFIIEPIHLGDLFGFVVSSENCDSVRVSDLERYKQRNCLNWIISAINVVSHEEIVVFWNLSSDFEEFLEIIELSMNISTNSYRSPYWLDVALIDQYFFCFVTKCSNAILRQWFAIKQSSNLLVKIRDIRKINFTHFLWKL